MRYFMHHEAKVNVFQNLKYDKLPPVRTFLSSQKVAKTTSNQNLAIELRDSQLGLKKVVRSQEYQSPLPPQRQKRYDYSELAESKESLAQLRTGDLMSVSSQEVYDLLGWNDKDVCMDV